MDEHKKRLFIERIHGSAKELERDVIETLERAERMHPLIELANKIASGGAVEAVDILHAASRLPNTVRVTEEEVPALLRPVASAPEAAELDRKYGDDWPRELADRKLERLGRFALASLPAETQDRPMNQAELHQAIETEMQKTRAQRAAGMVAGLGDPIVLTVAGWISLEADALERAGGEDPAVLAEIRALARALQDASAAAREALEP